MRDPSTYRAARRNAAIHPANPKDKRPWTPKDYYKSHHNEILPPTRPNQNKLLRAAKRLARLTHRITGIKRSDRHS